MLPTPNPGAVRATPLRVIVVLLTLILCVDIGELHPAARPKSSAPYCASKLNSPSAKGQKTLMTPCSED
jgi:hypothetical protein